MKILFIFLPLLMHGCSSADLKKYPFEVIESKTSINTDHLSQTGIVSTVYPGIPVIADEYLKSGRINRNPSISCFSKENSVNYVNINQEYVPLFRPYVLEMEKTVDYSSKAGFRDGNYSRLHVENTADSLNVKTKICFMDVDLGKGEERVMVVSEVYTKRK